MCMTKSPLESFSLNVSVLSNNPLVCIGGEARCRQSYLLYWTGIIPAFSRAMWLKIGWARSKWCKGGLHQPPLLLGSALFGGQKFVAVTMIDPGWHHFWSLKHLISKHAPHVRPLLKRLVLSAAVVVPYPWLYRFPYPQAPPVKNYQNQIAKNMSTQLSQTVLGSTGLDCVELLMFLPIVPDASWPP